MKAVAILLGVGGVLFVLTGGCSGQLTTWYTDSHGAVHTHCWSGCKSGVSDASGTGLPDSPLMEDALAIHAASISTNGDEANRGVFTLVNRATRQHGLARDALVRQELPVLAARITDAMPIVRASLLDLNLRTSASEICRTAVLRMLARTQSLYRTVSADLAAERAPARVIHEVIVGENAMSQAFTSDLEPCLSGLQPDSRSAVAYVLGG